MRNNTEMKFELKTACIETNDVSIELRQQIRSSRKVMRYSVLLESVFYSFLPSLCNNKCLL